MKNLEGLKLVARGAREILMTRELNAPRRLVFHAFTKPELVKGWLIEPPGWSMRLVATERFDEAWYPGKQWVRSSCPNRAELRESRRR